MKRLTPKLTHWFARLAFWRKPAAPTPEQLESPDPAPAGDSSSVETESGAAADVPMLPVGWFARLKQALNRRRSPVPEPSMDTDQTEVLESPSVEHSDATSATATADDVPIPRHSLLARLRNTLRRKPKPEQLAADADESQSSTERINEEAEPSDGDPDGDEDAQQAGRMRCALATLSSKWVWMPGVGILLLVPVAAMTLMLLQSEHEKAQLQAELIATQKKLEQTTLSKKAAASQETPKQAGGPAVAIVGSAAAATKPGVDAGDCLVSDKASVTQNLKNCIDSFNNAMDR